MTASSTTAQTALDTQTQAQPTTWQIDASHSLVEFSVRHMMVSTAKGRFADFAGTITFDPQNLSDSSVSVQIQAHSVTTADPKRDEHLRSADFFDVEKFPTLTFKSHSVARVEGDEFRLTGDLTIHGVTREVTLDVVSFGRTADPWGNEKAGFGATTKIKRSDYGLLWNAALETGGVVVGDDVKIAIDVELTKSK